MKNILITGGGFGNKGAQAMTFIAVSELSKRFPEHRLIVVSDKDKHLMKSDDYSYNFEIIGTDLCVPNGYYLLGGIWKVLAMKRGVRKKHITESKEIWDKTEYVIDISGYALGSNWGNSTSMLTVMWSALAERFGAKMVYMPQSFGPFEYEGFRGKIVDWSIGKYLKKASIIYAREKEGFELLEQQYGLDNVKQSVDLVLQNRSVDYKAIYKVPGQVNEYDVEQKSVAIIPNTENIKYIKKDELLYLYRVAIQYLLSKGYYVYIISHAKNDVSLCKDIKNIFEFDDKVIRFQQELTCLEFDSLVSKFEFTIASRYHSVVHSYRNGIPSIVIGWSDKYKELMKLCIQDAFCFDVRAGVDEKTILQAIESMIQKRDNQANNICECIESIRNKNVFDDLEML